MSRCFSKDSINSSKSTTGLSVLMPLTVWNTWMSQDMHAGAKQRDIRRVGQQPQHILFSQGEMTIKWTSDARNIPATPSDVRGRGCRSWQKSNTELIRPYWGIPWFYRFLGIHCRRALDFEARRQRIRRNSNAEAALRTGVSLRICRSAFRNRSKQPRRAPVNERILIGVSSRRWKKNVSLEGGWLMWGNDSRKWGGGLKAHAHAYRCADVLGRKVTA